MSKLPQHRVIGQGPSVLLVHGTAPDLFEQLERELSPTSRVIRVDRRGYPGSGLPVVSALPPHADDLAAILQREADAAIVVGWSIGGVIALELALRFPALVRGLVLLEPPWLAKKHPTFRMLGGILGGKLRGAFGNPASGGERFHRWALSRRDGRCELDDLAPADRARVRAAGPAMLAELDGGTGEHLEKLLGPLPMPVTLLTGDQSTVEFGAAAARLGRLLGVEPEVLPGAGHMMQETHARAVAAVVRRLAEARAA